MRLIREAQTLECENQRRDSCRSQFKKWLDISRSHDTENQCLGDERLQSEARYASFLFIARRATSVSPLAPSLKKAQSSLAVKWSSYIEAIGLKDTSSNKQRRVRFADADAEHYEPLGCTKQEKLKCPVERLNEMENFDKQLVHRGSRFADQPEDTILEQGFLTLPVNAPFFQNRRYYCLLRGHQLQLFTSAAHAAKNAGPKELFTVLRVQDCETLTMEKKLALFGAMLPPQIDLMFYVIKANGERVIFTADTKSSKHNWVHSLARLTYVGEGECNTSTPPLRNRSISVPTQTTIMLPPVPEVEFEEEMQNDMRTFGSLQSDRRSSCTSVC